MFSIINKQYTKQYTKQYNMFYSWHSVIVSYILVLSLYYYCDLSNKREYALIICL